MLEPGARVRIAAAIYDRQVAFQEQHGIRDSYIDNFAQLLRDDLAREEYMLMADAAIGSYLSTLTHGARVRLSAKGLSAYFRPQPHRIGTIVSVRPRPGRCRVRWDGNKQATTMATLFLEPAPPPEGRDA